MTGAIRRLHIGGWQKKKGWEIFDARATEVSDHVGNANDLSRFDDNTFIELYASHVLEHFDFRDEVTQVLCEWRRVLVPGGRLYVSVPDMDVLCALFLCKQALTAEERFHLIRMLFGAHTDRHDYHQSGFNREFLEHFVKKAGFTAPLVVEHFNLFEDTSNLVYAGLPISLNMIAKKPLQGAM